MYLLVLPIVKVAAVARTDVVAVTPNTPVREAAEIMLKKGVGSVVVVDPANPKRPLGIVGERDLLKAYVMGLSPDTPVSQVMAKLLVTVDAEAHVGEALLLMKANNVRRVIVTKGGELYGVLALRDIAYNIPLLKEIVEYFKSSAKS